MKKINFNFSNLSKPAKTVFIVSIILTSVVAIGVLLPLIEAASITYLLTPGTNVLDFRDITNTQNRTVSISSIKAFPTLDITVADNDANANLLSADTVLSSATSNSSPSTFANTILTETGINTGVFTGTITLSSSSATSGSLLQAQPTDDVSVFYLLDPSDDITTAERIGSAISIGKPRTQIILTGVSGGSPNSATISDFSPFDPLSADPCPFMIVTEYVNVDLLGTTTATEPITITMSYANARASATGLDPALFPVEELNIGYRIASGGATVSMNPGVGDGVDTSALTVTNVLQPSAVGGVIEGQYVLGWDVGCGGGGGGGLIRPGIVLNALAGIGAAGGGGGPPGPTVTLGALALNDNAVETISMPQEIRDIVLNHDPYNPLEPISDIYEDFDLPLSINGDGFALGGYENTLQTQTIETGEPTEFVIVYYTNSEIAHTSLYFNLGPTRSIAGSDTQVLLYKDKPAEVIDPNGNIQSATGSINNEGDLKRVSTLSVIFSESAELPNPDLVIRSWTDNLSSGDTIVYDAIEIAQPEIVEIADEDIPESEIQTLKSQYVPIWIKNNAAWWSQELIDDSDFVAGIEYLIQNEIITIQDNQVITTSISSNEIPEWIKNNAGWWSEDLITEKEFIDGLQWLISDGIIRVTET